MNVNMNVDDMGMGMGMDSDSGMDVDMDMDMDMNMNIWQCQLSRNYGSSEFRGIDGSALNKTLKYYEKASALSRKAFLTTSVPSQSWFTA